MNNPEQAPLTTLLPWHQALFAQMRAAHASKRLGHAWLLSGHQGTGKLAFARHLARTLLCITSTADGPCDSCRSCHQFRVGSHPDFLQVQPEKKLITVDQIRETIEYAQNTSQRGGLQILVFEPAEAMNLNAANALLKLLEEPTAQTLLLLVSHQSGLLLPTIRSRCQVLRCPLPESGQAEAWLLAQGLAGNPRLALQKAGGAPLRALAQAGSGSQGERLVLLDCLQAVLQKRMQPVEAARKCEKFAILATIDYLVLSLGDLLAALQAGLALRDTDLQTLLELVRVEARILPLHRLLASVQQARRVALASNNANQLLMLEALFAEWQQAVIAAPRRPVRQPMAL